MEDEPASGLVASFGGFSLHAGTVCEPWQRSRLERLCRYITRPPIATKRLSIDAQGRVVYRYKRPFRDGSTHVVLEPLDFMARLAALVPRPRLNLTRFHGVFAPNSRHRQRIVSHGSTGPVLRRAARRGVGKKCCNRCNVRGRLVQEIISLLFGNWAIEGWLGDFPVPMRRGFG